MRRGRIAIGLLVPIALAFVPGGADAHCQAVASPVLHCTVGLDETRVGISLPPCAWVGGEVGTVPAVSTGCPVPGH